MKQISMDVDDDFSSGDTLCDDKDSDYFPEKRKQKAVSKGCPISEITPTAFDSHCSVVL